MMLDLKKIPGFPNYLVSAAGDVYSTVMKGRNKRHHGPFLRKLIPASTGSCKYLTVKLYDKPTRLKRLLVHRLVMQTWKPANEEGLVCNHKNGDRKDNRLENLEWVTQRENIVHARDVLKRQFGRKKP